MMPTSCQQQQQQQQQQQHHEDSLHQNQTWKLNMGSGGTMKVSYLARVRSDHPKLLQHP